MIFNIGRIRLFAFIGDQESENYPQTKLGIGWYFRWFHEFKIYRSSKTLKFGPEANLFIFFGKKQLSLSIEYCPPKESL